jgi:hypothetical protein
LFFRRQVPYILKYNVVYRLPCSRQVGLAEYFAPPGLIPGLVDEIIS